MDTCSFLNEVNLLNQGHVNSIKNAAEREKEKERAYFVNLPFWKRKLEETTLQNLLVSEH